MTKKFSLIVQKINFQLSKHQDKWYFVPIVGAIFLVLILSSVLTINILSQPQTDNPEASPTPTPTQSPSPTPNSTQKPNSTTPPTSKPTPKPTLKPSPSIQPSPTQTPILEEKITLNKPENQQNFEKNDIDISVSVSSQHPINRVELVVDGAVQKTWYQAPYQDTINLKSGSLEIEAKAFLDNQQELKSSRIYIGVGGISWDTPDPTPTPTASSSANPS